MNRNQERNAEIVRRREAGEWPTEIAQAMGLSRNTVIGVCHRAGLQRTDVDRSLINRLFGRPVRGEAHYKAKLTEAAVRDIRAGGRARDLARKYGVKPNTVRAVKSGRAWKHAQT